jgi:predicted nucleic acid-binding protein
VIAPPTRAAGPPVSPSGVTLVDTSVLLDVVQGDATWGAWSEAALASALDAGPVVVNPVVFAEASVSYARLEALLDDLDALEIGRESLPWEAAFLAGKAFLAYRRAARGQAKASPLPDFFIGAHAAVAGHTLLTRDPRRVRTRFPTVSLVTPPPRAAG